MAESTSVIDKNYCLQIHPRLTLNSFGYDEASCTEFLLKIYPQHAVKSILS